MCRKLKEDYSFVRGVCYGVPYFTPVEQVDVISIHDYLSTRKEVGELMNM